MTKPTCREEVLSAMRRLERRHGKKVFQLETIVHEVLTGGSWHKESTIRTHVTSVMCVNAPNHHAVVHRDLERVGHGLYQLKGA
jgi:hypothetical protein